MFINISNHPISKWGEKQVDKARELSGDRVIKDCLFPNVSSALNIEQVETLKEEFLTKVGILSEEDIDYSKKKGDVFHVMGETSLCFLITLHLLRNGCNVVVSTTERETIETVNPDGTVTKTAQFEFVQFRKY